MHPTQNKHPHVSLGFFPAWLLAPHADKQPWGQSDQEEPLVAEWQSHLARLSPSHLRDHSKGGKAKNKTKKQKTSTQKEIQH